MKFHTPLIPVFLAMVLASCSGLTDSLGLSRYPQAYQEYALALSLEEPFMSLDKKLTPPEHITGNIMSKQGFAMAEWNDSDNGNGLKVIYQNGAMKEWWHGKTGFLSFSFRDYTLDPAWLNANRPLLKLLHAHERGGLSTITSLYSQYPELNTAKNNKLGAIIAAMNDNADIVEYYVLERKLSPDEKTTAWQEITDSVSLDRKNRSSRISIRDAARNSNAAKTLNMLSRQS